jgi:hypothetical protein
VLKRVFAAVKFHHIESVNFGSEIVIDDIVLAIKGDGPLSVRVLPCRTGSHLPFVNGAECGHSLLGDPAFLKFMTARLV